MEEAAVEVEEVEEDLPQPLALLHMAMEDPMGASKATLPLSSMETDPRANNVEPESYVPVSRALRSLAHSSRPS